MFRLFLVHCRRTFARHPGFTGLNILGIALGVTVFLSVAIINHSALESFRASIDIVAGRADLEIIGNGLGFDERAYPIVAQNKAIAAATPTVEEIASLADFSGEYLQVLGIDIFSNGPFRTFKLLDGPAQTTTDLTGFLRDPQTIAITRKLARRLHRKLGDSLRLETQAGIATFHIGFLLDFGADALGADEHIAVMDLANVQEDFLHTGKLSRISARLKPGADFAQTAAALRAQMPPGVIVQSPDRRNRQIERMIGAFQLNLTALSLISLLVGMFIIYNTVATAVVRRRQEIGILRALGLSGGQIQALFLGEALVLGAIGLGLGLVLGVLLASQLVGAVSRTLTSLYILSSIETLFLSPWTVLAATVLCLGAVFLAAWFPAREAAQIAPVEALGDGFLEEKTVRGFRFWPLGGFGMFLFAVILAEKSLHGGPAWLSFGCALFTLLGFAFFVPAASVLFTRTLRPPGMVATLALRQFARSLHRHAVAIASLVVALAMVVGISTMIYSFRTTVEIWLNRSIRADLVIAPAANLVLGNREVVRPEVVALVEKTPHAQVDSFRELDVEFQGQLVKLAAVRLDLSRDVERLNFEQGTSQHAFAEAIAQGGVLVSAPFWRRFHLGLGDYLTLSTPTGLHRFRIAGVYTDYTSESGVILVDRALYRRDWEDNAVNGMAVYLDRQNHPEPGAQMEERFRRELAPYGQYIIKSNEELRVQVFRIFDQTFAVTYLLQTIGLIVSGLSIFLTLTILVAERRRELSILRAVGASRRQVERMILWEAVYLGAIGSALGIMAGLALAWVLSNVINVSFFGWTISWATPWLSLILLPFLVITAAVCAGYVPARSAGRVEIAAGVKME